MLLKRPALALGLAVLLLLAPSLILGTQLSHSSSLNLNWALQFAAQFRAGILYPRWMPDSFGGLGSPAFYFYPPLPFWLDALVSVLSFDVLSVQYRLVVTSALILWASGLAMHAWLRAETGDAHASSIGALLYIAAPYHLFDHYIRGAFAEFTAFATLPLVMLALNGIARRRQGGAILLAVGYAMLLLSHLPTALLASATLFPAYALWRVRRPIELLVGGALGIGLAAIYVAPAMLLQDWISAEWLWSSFYRIDAWSFLLPSRWPDPGIMRVVVPLTISYALAALAIVAHRRAIGFWTATCLVCLLLISGVVPWFWQLPQLEKVQFPWRLLTVAEFALVTGLCVSPRLVPRGIALWLLAGAAIALAWAGTVIVGDTAQYIALGRQYSPLPRFDTQEYQPHGFPGATTESNGMSGLRRATSAPLIACNPEPRVCRATQGAFGALDIEIEGDMPTTAAVHRFYFPAWRLTPSLPIVATDPLRLVSFTAPPGRTTVKLDRTMLPVERWSAVVSAVSLLLVLILAMAERRSSAQRTQ